MNQRVLCLRGVWANRSDVVEFVANVAGGVHAGTIDKPEEQMLDKLWMNGEINASKEGFLISLNVDNMMNIQASLTRRSGCMNPVMAELLGTIQILTRSPDVARLEK